MDNGERLTEEHVEKDGEDNADWLWPSLVCAVKNEINIDFRPTSKKVVKITYCFLGVFFPGRYQSSCLNWSQC